MYNLNWADTLLTIFIGIVVYFLSSLIPTLENYFLDVLTRSSIIVIVYVSLILLFKISKDFTDIVSQISIKFEYKYTKCV
jgi:hypothetical protein